MFRKLSNIWKRFILKAYLRRHYFDCLSRRKTTIDKLITQIKRYISHEIDIPIYLNNYNHDTNSGVFIFVRNGVYNTKYEDNADRIIDISHNLYSRTKDPTYLDDYFKSISRRYKGMPRIEIYMHSLSISRKNIFTLIHELGHYDLYKKQLEQTEQAADNFLNEMIKRFMNVNDIMALKLDISIKTNRNISGSFKELYNFVIDCYGLDGAFNQIKQRNLLFR